MWVPPVLASGYAMTMTRPSGVRRIEPAEGTLRHVAMGTHIARASVPEYLSVIPYAYVIMMIATVRGAAYCEASTLTTIRGLDVSSSS
jgi:hypothetical protein